MAGWLFADGYIHRKSISIQICEQDAINMRPIFQSIGTWGESFINIKKRYPTRQNAILFRMGNAELVKKFKKIDFHLKSTYISQTILDRTQKYFHLFLRGFFDGDGCWYYNGKNCRQFSVTGPVNYNWKWLSDYCDNIGASHYKITSKQKGGWGYGSVFRIANGCDIKILGNNIYQDHLELKLNRKYEKYLKMTKSLTC